MLKKNWFNRKKRKNPWWEVFFLTWLHPLLNLNWKNICPNRKIMFFMFFFHMNKKKMAAENSLPLS